MCYVDYVVGHIVCCYPIMHKEVCIRFRRLHPYIQEYELPRDSAILSSRDASRMFSFASFVSSSGVCSVAGLAGSVCVAVLRVAGSVNRRVAGVLRVAARVRHCVSCFQISSETTVFQRGPRPEYVAEMRDVR